MSKEKSYKEFSKQAKQGIEKFSTLSSKGMKEYADKYRKKTGKNPYHVGNKEDFYEWVNRNRIRTRKV